MMSFTTLLVVSCIVDGLVMLACTALFMSGGRQRWRLTLPRAFGAAAVSAAILAIKARVVMAAAQVNLFGLFHMAYIDLVIVWPTIALLLLLADVSVRSATKHRVLTTPVRVLAALVVIGAPAIGIYATFIEPTNLQVERAELIVSEKRNIDKPIRIGVLADFQTDRVGGYETRAIDTLLAERPDLIIIPGDIFQGSPAQLEAQLPSLREQFARLTAPGGVYFCYGNCDPPRYIDAIFSGLGIHILRNELTHATVNGNQITIVGLEEQCDSSQARVMIDFLETAPGNELRLLIGHYPDALLHMQYDSRIDLLIAGHTHGGQVCVPFFGPPITLTDVPRDIAAGGLHELNGRAIYVSRGAGLERGQAPRLRFLCPPEVSVVTVSSSDQ